MIDWADLEARNAPLNAFVDWDKGATAGAGPLSGLTFGIKSNIAVAGLPWTGGMGVYRNRLAKRDAAVVAILRAAGATILGSLNMHEAALGATTDNAFYVRTHNAHRHGYTPGGSSGGSGAAVAAGLCDAALGTDTMGSVRIPAAYNGVYGLKPTHGAVSQDGLAMLEPSLDCIGPLARDLNVLERVWSVISSLFLKGRGTDAKRQGEGNAPPSPSLPSVAFPSPLQGEGGNLLILTDLANVTVQPAVHAAYDRALASFDLPTRAITLTDPVTDIRMAGFVASARWLIEDLGELRHTHADEISPELHFMLAYAEKCAPRPDVIERTKATLVDALGSDGFLLMPTAPQAAFPHAKRPPANQADFTCLASVAGLPALALPAGFDNDRLQVGVQIVGTAGSEARLFALARDLADKLRGYAPPSPRAQKGA